MHTHALGWMTCLCVTGSAAMTASAQDVLIVPDEFPTIQAAIDQANDGDFVQIMPGTYHEAINLGARNINIRGSGTDVTIIDATGHDSSTVTLSPTDSVSIEDITITGGSGSPIQFVQTELTAGGGLLVQSGAVALFNCRIVSNSAHLGGGIFVSAGASASLLNCHVGENVAATGGGLFSNAGQPIAATTTFENNQAENGGAAFIVGDGTFDSCEFRVNGAEQEGGGVLVAGGMGSFASCVFYKNESSGNGGALRITEHAIAEVTESSFVLNSAADAAVSIGAISDVTLAESVFCENAPTHVSDNWTDEGGNVFSESCDDLCAGQCGEQAANGCWCDQACKVYDDCCADACQSCSIAGCDPDFPVTCEGMCGGTPPQGCWCDMVCFSFGDCCPDVCQWCDYPGCDGGRDSCVGLCGMDALSGCRCHPDCVAEDNCCHDACSECGHCQLGDLNGDGIVNVNDLLILLAAWGECPPSCPADLNGDGFVDVADLLLLLGNWS